MVKRRSFLTGLLALPAVLWPFKAEAKSIYRDDQLFIFKPAYANTADEFVEDESLPDDWLNNLIAEIPPKDTPMFNLPHRGSAKVNPNTKA